MNKIDFNVDSEFVGKRLDIALLLLLESKDLSKMFFSRSKIQEFIKNGNVLINGKPKKGSYALQLNDKIECDLDIEEEVNYIKPWKDVVLDIVYEDDDLLVINKGPEFVVHPGAGNKDKTLLNAVIDKLSFNNESKKNVRVGIVHRIDKDTTGLLVVAKNEFSQVNLMKQFKEHSVDRQYMALVLSTPRADREVNKSDEGVINTFIGRHKINRLKRAVLEDEGKIAITHWKKIEEMRYACLLSFKLETGRTHQIRVHMDYIHSPIIGDKMYGDFSLLPYNLRVAEEKFGRQALHAKNLGFIHPVTGKRLFFDSSLPEDFQSLIEIFRKG